MHYILVGKGTQVQFPRSFGLSLKLWGDITNALRRGGAVGVADGVNFDEHGA